MRFRTTKVVYKKQVSLYTQKDGPVFARVGMTQEMHPTFDEILRQKILACFAANDHISPANLRVGVANGIVHLAGCLATMDERRCADGIAASIPGVRGVVNRIEAPGAPCPARTVILHFIDKRGNMHE